MSKQSIDTRVRIGHVHLKVADLERALQFSRDVLGFELQHRLGTQAAFISAGRYHHHIGLNTWESLGGPPPPPGSTGLYHLAILYPSRAALAEALRRLLEGGRPRGGWPRAPDGTLDMYTRALDLRGLLAESAQ